MKDAITIIAGLVKDVLLHVYKLESEGRKEEALQVVADFEAFTQAQLRSDRSEAERILKRRFQQ